MSYRTDFRSIRDEVSPEEWQTRVDLAACYRLVALYGMDDLTATHISARVPGAAEHFLINPYGLLFSQVTASGEMPHILAARSHSTLMALRAALIVAMPLAKVTRLPSVTSL